MLTLVVLSLIGLLTPLGSGESAGNVFTFTHSMSTSHLSVVFNLADRLSEFDVYDLRWPMVKSVATFKAPSRFRTVISTRTLEKGAELQRFVDAGGWESEDDSVPCELPMIFTIIKEIVRLLLMPCDFKDPITVERISPLNISLIDPFCSLCAIARTRELRSRYVLVSALVEPMALTILSGGELPLSYAPSVVLAKSSHKMTFLDRTLNMLGHGMFFLLIKSQLMTATLMFGKNELFAPMEPSFVLVNAHRSLDFPVPRTFGFIDIGLRNNVVSKVSIDQDLLDFVENPAFRKIVVFSMSTYTSDGEMPLNIREAFAKAFAEPQFQDIGFVWRIRDLEEEFRRPNIKVVPWIAQRVLFEHPKTSGVISHCGRNSFPGSNPIRNPGFIPAANWRSVLPNPPSRGTRHRPQRAAEFHRCGRSRGVDRSSAE